MHHEGPSLEHPTWFKFLLVKKLLPAWIPEMVIVTWFVIALLCITAIIASRKLSVRNPGKFQSALEFIVISLDGFVRNIVGDEAKVLTPIIGTTFIYILTLSLIGLVPGFVSPTSSPNTTVALALMAFCLVQYFAITRQSPIIKTSDDPRSRGFFGFIRWIIQSVGNSIARVLTFLRLGKLSNYLKHFLGEPIWLAPLMLPLHIIGELARPLSLSIRLFGNIFGEETVIAVFVLIVTSVLGKLLIPLQFPMMLFAIFGGFIQALVFSMLVCIYIAVALQGHEEHH